MLARRLRCRHNPDVRSAAVREAGLSSAVAAWTIRLRSALPMRLRIGYGTRLGVWLNQERQIPLIERESVLSEYILPPEQNHRQFRVDRRTSQDNRASDALQNNILAGLPLLVDTARAARDSYLAAVKVHAHGFRDPKREARPIGSRVNDGCVANRRVTPDRQVWARKAVTEDLVRIPGHRMIRLVDPVSGLALG